MEIPKLPECNLVLVFAPVSSGKSWLLQRWIESMERSCILDTTAEAMDPAFTHVWHNPRHFLELLRVNPYMYRIAYHPSGRNFYDDFRWCVTGMWLTRGQDGALPRWMIVDEVHEVCSNSSVTEEMDMIIRYARHCLLGVIGATQKFSDVNRLMTQNCRMIVLFHTMEPVDLDAIRKRLGTEAEAQVRELRPLILNEVTKEVEQHPQCLVWVRGQGTKIFSLGDLVKTTETQLTPNPQTQEEECHVQVEAAQKEPEKLSSEPLSGVKENQ